MRIIKNLIFAALGLALMWVTAEIFVAVPKRMIGEWNESRRWVEVPAILISHELVEVQGGQYNNDYITAKYTYQYNDESFTGDRVSLYIAPEDREVFLDELNQELIKVSNNGGSMSVWVDPNSPTRSVINRDLRIVMLTIFLLMIGFFGLLSACVFGVFSRPAPKLIRVDKIKYPKDKNERV